MTTTPSSTTPLQELVRAVETADSKPGIVLAVRNLAAAHDPGAIPALIQVLGYNNPGAAVAAVDGLVALGSTAVPALLEQLDGYNYGARAWAIRALALIGDARALTILLETAQGDFAFSVRRAAARGLGTLNWEQFPVAERESAQQQALNALITVTADPEWVVRYGAIVGLEALGQVLSLATDSYTTIRSHLQTLADQDEVLAVSARARLGLERLGR